MTRDPAVADIVCTLEASFRRQRALTRRAEYLSAAIETAVKDSASRCVRETPSSSPD